MNDDNPITRVQDLLRSQPFRLGIASVALAAALLQRAGAGVLMEEGFPYPPAALGMNPPWTGSYDSVAVVSGRLERSPFLGVSGPGGLLRITPGSDGSTVRNFSDTPILPTDGVNVYFSAFIRCLVLPGTNDLPLASLQASGGTGPSGRADPLCLYVRGTNDTYQLGIRHTEIDQDFAPVLLTTNTTHFIVMKYLWGAGGDAQLYIDPPPGREPFRPSADSELARDADDGIPVDPADLQVVGFRSLTNLDQGVWEFGSLRIGTNWADVTPSVIPLALTGPASQTACVGNPITFSVVAVGNPPFRYQWRAGGVAVDSATNSSYTLTSPQPSDALNLYDVMVSDAFESLTSSVAALSLTAVAPSITVPPANQAVLLTDSNVIFSVVGAGDAPLSYQWRTNGVPVPWATNTTYALTNPSPLDALNAYDVVVTNPCGSVTSTPPVTLSFAHPFFAGTALPGFFSGMNLIITNTAGAILYAWSSADPTQSVTNWTLEGQLQEQPLNDGTGNSIYAINVTPVSSTVYYVIGPTTVGPYVQPAPVQWITTDAFGNYTFSIASLTISPDGILAFAGPPAITGQPQDQVALAGKNVTFSVAVNSSEPPGYQWYFNTSTPLVSATNAVLLLSAVTASQAGTYQVVVANTSGSVTSSAAALAILAPPQLNATNFAGALRLSAAGVPGDTYWVQATTNLAAPGSWVTLLTNVVGADGGAGFVDTNTSIFPNRFYRLLFP